MKYLLFIFLILLVHVGSVGCDGSGGLKAAEGPGSMTPNPPGAACVKVTVSWDPPTKMTDGSAIPPGYLAGYKLYLGLASGQYSQEFVINGAATKTYVVTGLNKDLPYYMAIKSLASDNQVSEYSSEVQFVKATCETSQVFIAKKDSPKLITDSVQIGCGWSDLVYEDLVSRLSEKSVSQYPIKSKGPESGRRLYFFSDRSWLLSLEFFSPESTNLDKTCLVAHGAGEESEKALEYILKDYPEWKWGTAPENWPESTAPIVY